MPSQPGSELADETAANADAATTRRLCAYFARLGTLGFGGPVALVGYMQRDLVDQRGWISPQEYRDGLAIAQMAPGPLAAQLAMWLAFVRQGVRGATLASFAFIGPPFLMVVALAWVYVTAGGAHWIGSLFYGIAPAAIAIITVSAYRLIRLIAGRDPLLWIVLVAVGLITFLTEGEVALAFIAAGFLVVLVRVGPASIIRGLRRRLPGSGIGIGSALFVPLFPPAAGDPRLLAELALFFVKAGAFVFGSGLAIVPFLRQGLLVEHHWLTDQQFLDAVAVGLITPGPIVITAAFVGFLIAGLPGALIGAFGVFLPVYVFVILPGRWFLRYRDSQGVRAFVAGVSAAAAGAITAASVILGRQAILDGPTLVISVVALLTLLAIRRYKPQGLRTIGEPVVVLAAGLFGLALRGV